MNKWLINPQRFDQYSYALNNPLRYTDPTGLSTLVCCDPQCNYICENDDANNSNPGGTEGSPQYSTSDSDDEEETDDDIEDDTEPDSRQEECADCDCKDRLDIKALRKLKWNVFWGGIGITAAYTLLCGFAGAILCGPGGPVAAMCAVVGGAACGIFFGALTAVEISDIIADINWTMKKLGCECAVYCKWGE
jgi:hypothetical protein